MKREIKPHHQDFEYGAMQYRTGKSINECAKEIGVTRVRLFDYISKHGVVQDLGKAIRDKTTEFLAGDIVEVNGRLPSTREDVIAINATLQASLIRGHREDISRFRRLVMQLLTELEGMTNYQDVLEDLGTLMRSDNDKGVDKLNDAYHRVIGLPGRTETLKKLGDTLKVLIALERQAFGMREDFEDEETQRARIANRNPAIADFDIITRKFMKVLGQEVTDVQPT